MCLIPQPEDAKVKTEPKDDEEKAKPPKKSKDFGLSKETNMSLAIGIPKRDQYVPKGVPTRPPLVVPLGIPNKQCQVPHILTVSLPREGKTSSGKRVKHEGLAESTQGPSLPNLDA